MTQTYFVTGTDTDVGKTVCCAALLQAAQQQGCSTLGYKPIAAGCAETESGLRNDDALTLQRNSSISVSYEQVNPIAYQDPIAPHIAAARESRPIVLSELDQGLTTLQQHQPDLLLVEGAGGWHLPINDKQLLSQWVVEKQLPVIMVVGMKLGCLNHAMLTYQALCHDGVQVVGWIANQLATPMPFYAHNLAWLKQKIAAPLIAQIPALADPERAQLAQYVDFQFPKKAQK